MTDDLHSFEREYAPDAAERRRPGGRRWPTFLVGLVLGAVAALILPPLLSPYVPEALRRAGEDVVGVVAEKQREEGRLLLTVRAPQGAILATFDRRVSEIDLLVSRGDTVTLGVGEYEPFVENPILRGVRKVDAEAVAPRDRPEPPPAEDEPEGHTPEDGLEAPPPTDGAEPRSPEDG